LVIVIGEVVISLFVEYENPDWSDFLAIFMILTILWVIETIYFDVEGGKMESHAMRRRWWTGLFLFEFNEQKKKKEQNFFMKKEQKKKKDHNKIKEQEIT